MMRERSDGRNRSRGVAAAIGITIVAVMTSACAAGQDGGDTTPSAPDRQVVLDWASQHPTEWSWMREHWTDMVAAHDHWGDQAWMKEHMASAWPWMQAHWSDVGWMQDHWESMAWMHSSGMMGSGATPGGMMSPSSMMGG